jgi:hypothetical protein
MELDGSSMCRRYVHVHTPHNPYTHSSDPHDVQLPSPSSRNPPPSMVLLPLAGAGVGNPWPPGISFKGPKTVYRPSLRPHCQAARPSSLLSPVHAARSRALSCESSVDSLPPSTRGSPSLHAPHPDITGKPAAAPARDRGYRCPVCARAAKKRSQWFNLFSVSQDRSQRFPMEAAAAAEGGGEVRQSPPKSPERGRRSSRSPPRRRSRSPRRTRSRSPRRSRSRSPSRRSREKRSPVGLSSDRDRSHRRRVEDRLDFSARVPASVAENNWLEELSHDGQQCW